MSIMEIRENQSATSQSEVKKRALDALAQNVLDAANQIFPSIERPTTDHEELTVAELSNPTFNIKVICPRARVCDTSKQIRRSVRFQCYCDDAPHKSHLHYQYHSRIQRLADELGIAYMTIKDTPGIMPPMAMSSGCLESFQNDWSFPSSKIRTLVYESAGIKRSINIYTHSNVKLKHYNIFTDFPTHQSPDSPASSHPFPERYFHIILWNSITRTDEKSIYVTTQTQISHETNPLGRLFVTLSDVALVEYHKHDEERENCDIHFGFDEREVAECFAGYLKIAQMKLFEKSMRGPFCDEKIIYCQYVRKELNINTTELIEKGNYRLLPVTERKIEYRSVYCHETWVIQINNTVANVETLDLLQSTIWVCDHDANGQPYSSQTDWETLTGQSIVKPTKRATFVKSGHERTANDWLDDLDKLFRVMKPDRNDRYEKVKIAVIDSGLNDTVKRRYMTQNDIVYKDFCHETGNNSWHGTCCAKIIGDMYEEAKFSIARIFQEDHSNDSEGPIRMAKAIDWAISNSVDIISISAGFRDYSKELDEAVTRAKAAGTLVVAAAANWQNTGTVAFPARHNLTTMCVYSTNVGNQSSTFNPEPRSDTPNFAVLGEGFQHPDQKSEPMSGTSMSTAAAVGLAANIIDFARQSDNKSYIYRSQDVGKLPGMLSIFDAISKPAGSLRYVEPLNLLPGNKGYSRERGRQRVREILSQAMERAN
ncbi:unnamed protein product [Fusarium graminearum]|uniref:Peptidase S8/S53 domain-containing protein n=1 Tax=Gibberella zeae TaxID=5518 RepID=A0A4E9DSX3_GIBZA|nr:unnamed protein product [Fusarium graminearum]CAF3558192.1 unnamed protein product [Fusarium graminearum]CAG1999308.1 unnamed protein product [Fusarium graminearum]